MKVIYNGKPDVKAFKDVLGTRIPEMLDADPDLIYLCLLYTSRCV